MDGGQLFPQEGDIHLDIVVFHVAFIAPDLFDKAFFGQNLSRIGEEHFHDLIFLQTEFHPAVALDEVIGLAVQLEFPEMQAVHFHLAFPPGQRPDTGKEFAGGKGLCEIIVCAAIQPVDLVFHLGLCGQQHNGRGVFFLPQDTDNLGAAANREHDIQKDAVIDTGTGVFETVVAVKDGIHVVLVAFEDLCQGIRQLDFILDHEYVHCNHPFESVGFQYLL